MSSEPKNGEASLLPEIRQPPPLPSPGSKADPSATGVPGGSRRLHPLSILVPALGTIRGLIIPAIVLGVVSGPLVALGFALFFVVLPALVFSVVHYFTFSYRIDEEELVTRQGLFEIKERRIPFRRVQDIRMEQSLVSRVFGLTKVQVETAGGSGEEASLAYVLQADAEALKTELFRRRGSSPGTVETTGLAAEEESFTLIHEVPAKNLLIAGFTSKIMATLFAFLGIFPYAENLFFKGTRIPNPADRIFESVEEGMSENTPSLIHYVFSENLGKAAVLVSLGLVMSITGYIFLFFRFRLSLGGEVLNRRYGLFTRRASSISRRRVQVAKVEEPLMRRWFRLATVRADTAGDHQEARQNDGGRDVLVPILPRREVMPLMEKVFPDLEDYGEAAEWRRVSPKAVGRSARRGFVVLMVFVGFAGVNVGWMGLTLLAAAPVIYLLSLLAYRHTGYLVDPTFFRFRRGWWDRALHVMPIRNIQAVSLQQTPFDRRLGLATLTMDTAGRTHTGGMPRIRNLPLETAQSLHISLARRAARMRYRFR